MRKLWGAGLLTAGLAVASSAAMAADVPAGFSDDAYWQGGYVGVVGGYGAGTAGARNGYGGADLELNPNGWIVGGQAGFDWQYDHVVFGLEASINMTGMKATGVIDYGSTPPSTGVTTISQTLDAYGAVRARLGLAAGRLMPYVNGGLAFGKGTRTSESCTTGCPAKQSKTFTGWTVGGGVEIGVGEHWTLRGEYAYVDLGTQNFVIPGPSGGSNVHMTANTVTGSINYRF